MPAADRAVGSGELRSFLQDRLPEPIVPSGFVFLDGSRAGGGEILVTDEDARAEAERAKPPPGFGLDDAA